MNQILFLLVFSRQKCIEHCMFRFNIRSNNSSDISITLLYKEELYHLHFSEHQKHFET